MLQDLYVGVHLTEMVERLGVTPPYVVSLAPRTEIVAKRERGRPKCGYVGGMDGRGASEGPLCSDFASDTPLVGLRLETSDLSPRETVAAIV